MSDFLHFRKFLSINHTVKFAASVIRTVDQLITVIELDHSANCSTSTALIEIFDTVARSH